MRLSCNFPDKRWCSCGSIEVVFRFCNHVKISGLQCLLCASLKPLGSGWLIGILIMVYEIIPKKLGSSSSPI